MASNKRIPALNVKLKEYKKSQDGKGIELLTHEEPIEGKYAYLELNDPKYYKEDEFGFYAKTCLSKVDSKGNKWLIGSMNKGALNNLFNLNFTKDNKPDVEAESKWIDNWSSNGCLFLLCVNDNPTLSHIVEKTQGYLFEISENTTLPFVKENKELITKIDDAIAYQIEHQEAKEEYYEDSLAIPAFFFDSEELKRLRIKHTPEYEGEFPDKLIAKIQLPDIEQKGKGKGFNKGGGTYNNYMSTQERLDSTLELLEGKNAEKFDLLYAHYVDDPSRTAFALALTGLTIHQKNNTEQKEDLQHTTKNGNFNSTKEIENSTDNNKLTNSSSKRGRKPKADNNNNNEDTQKSKPKSNVGFEEENYRSSSYPIVHNFLIEHPSEISTNVSDEARDLLNALIQDSYSEETEAYLELLTQILEYQINGKSYPEREVKRILIADGYVSPILCYNTEELEVIVEKLGITEPVLQ